MNTLLAEHAKGNHQQATRDMRKTEADNIFAEGWYDLQR